MKVITSIKDHQHKKTSIFHSNVKYTFELKHENSCLICILMSNSDIKSINWWTFLHDHPRERKKNVLICLFVSGGEFVSELFPIIFVEAPNPLKNSSSLKFSLHGCLSIECGETGVPTLIYNTHQFLSNRTRSCSHNDYPARL